MTSLYQQEMAKRGYVLPKKEACPRKATRLVVYTPMPERTTKKPAVADRTRWMEWADLYRGGLTLSEIGKQYDVSFQSVQYALDKMKVPRRKKGYGFTQHRMAMQLEALRKENRLLRSKLAGLRRRGITEEAA